MMATAPPAASDPNTAGTPAGDGVAFPAFAPDPESAPNPGNPTHATAPVTHTATPAATAPHCIQRAFCSAATTSCTTEFANGSPIAAPAICWANPSTGAAASRS